MAAGSTCAANCACDSARASEADRVAGLELGADDYLTKPFSLRELVLRVGNLLRRQSAGTAGTPAAKRTVCGDLDIDSELRRAFRGGRELSLTPREFDLLAHLARHPDRVFTRSQLLSAIWGPRFEGFEHTVNSHINRLRAKLEADPRHPTRLVTVWGCGYRLVSSDR
jgi:DNA-binding response OmpR family regulator